MEDEGAAIRATKAVTHKDGDEVQIRDFRLAARIAREGGVSGGAEFTGERDTEFNKRKKQIFEENMEAFRSERGRGPTPKQTERLWNEAALAAMQGGTWQAEEGGPPSQGRRSGRIRRQRGT